MIRVIYSIDSNNGYLFNNRRQTFDKNVIDYIVKNIVDKDSILWLSDYSKELFNDFDLPTKKLESVDLSTLDDKNIIFVENINFDIEEAVYKGFPVELIFFKWNKVYPADKKLNFTQFYLNNFEVSETKNIVGDIHDSILFEKWTLKKR